MGNLYDQYEDVVKKGLKKAEYKQIDEAIGEVVDNLTEGIKRAHIARPRLPEKTSALGKVINLGKKAINALKSWRSIIDRSGYKVAAGRDEFNKAEGAIKAAVKILDDGLDKEAFYKNFKYAYNSLIVE